VISQPLLLATLLRLNKWTEPFQRSGVILRLPPAPASGIERELLLKSLQEAPFSYADFQADFTTTANNRSNKAIFGARLDCEY
jgi:hypothetical protein